MARKKSNDEQGVSMDSLMDALTNVVAVFVIAVTFVPIVLAFRLTRDTQDVAGSTN